MKFLRRHWHDLGAVVALAVGRYPEVIKDLVGNILDVTGITLFAKEER